MFKRASRRWAPLFLAAIAVVVFHAGAAEARRVALLIGNQKYAANSQLNNPMNDVELMRASFEDAGFDSVKTVFDLDRSAMVKALREFEDESIDAEMAVVYYSGHAMEMNGVNYLLPVDAALKSDRDVEDESVAIDRVQRSLEGAKKLKLFILDACRNNPFSQSMKRTAGTRSMSRGLARVEPESADTLIAFASKAGTVALDGEGRNSPFATALAKYLVEPGVDVRIALGKVRDEVVQATNREQEPFVYGSLGGAQIFLNIKEVNIDVNNSGNTEAVSPNGQSEAAADWQNIRDLADKDLLDAFIAQHGQNRFYRILAEKKLASLQETTRKTGQRVDAVVPGKIKVCFLYVGSRTDGGYSESHDRGRLELEKALGDRVETAFLENVPEGPAAEKAVESLARSGCKLVFATSFGFMDATLKVAEKFPDVTFEHATGYRTSKNVGTYNARSYEGRYIQGVIAAKVSRTGTAGYIGSFPIPEVIMGINAFMLGGRSVDPDFKVKVAWAHTWADPAKEAEAARTLADQGADVLAQHTDSTAPMQVAAKRGIKAFGQASDMIAIGPKAQLTAIVDTWGAYYIKRTQAIIDGDRTAEQAWEGLKDGILTMAPYTNMPDDVKRAAEEVEARIRSGALHPFTGPVKKQDGSNWLAAGAVSDDGALLGMNFYVAGIDDRFPM